MAGIKSERARDRARDLLATVYPAPDDVEFRRLRQLAIDYVQEAQRLEAEKRGRVVESDELISTALDAVARDYFQRAVLRAVCRRLRWARFQAGAGSPSAGGLWSGGIGDVRGPARWSSTSLVTAATELPTLSTMAFSESAGIPSRRFQART